MFLFQLQRYVKYRTPPIIRHKIPAIKFRAIDRQEHDETRQSAFLEAIWCGVSK